MAETDNPDAPLGRVARSSEASEGKTQRRERGHGGQQSGPARMIQFLRDVRAEMRRVSWPTMIEVRNTTIITLVAVVFFAIYLFLVDQGLSRLITGIDWLLDKIARFLGLG